MNLPDQEVVSITAGDSHTAFLTANGRIYLTGTMRDANGAFGLNTKAGSELINKYPFLYMDKKSKDESVVKDVPLKISSGKVEISREIRFTFKRALSSFSNNLNNILS